MIRKSALFPVMIVNFGNVKIKLLDWFGLISSKREIYIEYDILTMNVIRNATKLEKICFTRHQMFLENF